jgi:hypothetical protein
MPQSSAGSACLSLAMRKAQNPTRPTPTSTDFAKPFMLKNSRTPTNTDVELAYGLLRAGLGLNIVMHGLARLLAGTGCSLGNWSLCSRKHRYRVGQSMFSGLPSRSSRPFWVYSSAGIEDTLGPGERMRIALRTHLRIVTSAGLGDHGAATDLHGHHTARRHPVELVFHRRYAAKAIRRLRPLLGLGRFYKRIFVRVIISTFLMAGLIAFSASAQETKMRQDFFSGRSRFQARRPRQTCRLAWEAVWPSRLTTPAD